MPAQIVARSETHKRVLRGLEELKNTEISAERQKELDAFDAKILALRQADTNHDGDIDRGEWSTAMKQEGGSSTSRSSSSSSSYSDADVRQTTKPVISTPIRTSYTSSYSYTPAPLRNSYASSSVTSYTPAPASSRTGGYDPWARYQSTLGTARKAPKPLGPRPAFTRDSPEGTSGGAAVVTSSYSTYSSAAPSAASSTSSSASSTTSSNASASSSSYAPWNNYKTTLSPQKGPTERRSNVLRLSLGGSRRMFRSDTHKRVLEKLGLDENASPTKRNKIDAEAEVQSEFDAKILALRKADTNHDGDIDRSEWSTAVAAV